ncbi:MAG: hypothetical protein HYT49_03560 [Candidatus Wildermuthbacteria bacterium]|nr:hypothetical protein [Candidatus Wildermuthbacteria bacterium]
MSKALEKLAEILGTTTEKLEELEKAMVEKGFEPALEKVAAQNDALAQKALQELGVESGNAEEVLVALTKKVGEDEEQLYKFLDISPENLDFQKVADAARAIATQSEGFFLKREFGEQILRQRPPTATLNFLGYKNVDELLEKQDVTEVFSALRFLETNEWMHETFAKAYTKFTPADFEHRSIEITVLGRQWEEVAKKYVEKKHHNVSHLKEFGVIFLNPIAESGKGKFVRDFALLLHYFHEIAFYSELFQQYAQTSGFQEKFISLLRGDVPEIGEPFDSAQGEWLITQRYLWKENPQDPRLFLPHVNPESMHWRKAEQDLVEFGKKQEEINLEFWNQLWSVAEYFNIAQGARSLLSFDLEDIAMTLVSRTQGKSEYFTYHQHEALWNRIFAEYVGGYDKVEKHIIANMEKGVISF